MNNTENTQRPRRPRRLQRSGAAFLILIVVVLLVVVAATQTLVRSELSGRRSESDRMRVRAMKAAIDAVSESNVDSGELVRLPLDDASREHIEVTLNEEESVITARWLRGDQLIDEMKHKIEIESESTE